MDFGSEFSRIEKILHKFQFHKENFAKHEIDNLTKFLRKHENRNFRTHPSHRTIFSAKMFTPSHSWNFICATHFREKKHQQL